MARPACSTASGVRWASIATWERLLCAIASCRVGPSGSRMATASSAARSASTGSWVHQLTRDIQRSEAPSASGSPSSRRSATAFTRASTARGASSTW